MARDAATTWKSEALLTAIGKAAPRECITEARLVEITGNDARSIENSCVKLRKHGFMVKTARGCHTLTAAGRAAVAQGAKLRSGPQGPRTGRVVQKGSLRAAAWRAMRIKRKFSIADLVMLCAEGGERDIESNIGKYVRALERAGFVGRLAVREPGFALTSNGFARWRLIIDNGPLPPVSRVSRGIVYDPNTEQDFTLAKGVSAPGKAPIVHVSDRMRRWCRRLKRGVPIAGCGARLYQKLGRAGLIEADGTLTELGEAVCG